MAVFIDFHHRLCFGLQDNIGLENGNLGEVTAVSYHIFQEANLNPPMRMTITYLLDLG